MDSKLAIAFVIAAVAAAIVTYGLITGRHWLTVLSQRHGNLRCPLLTQSGH
jgi:hypothetical protein